MSRRLGKGWKQMRQEIDTEELAYQMAYDLVEAEERTRAVPGARSGPAWIDLSGPDVFTLLKQRAGLA